MKTYLSGLNQPKSITIASLYWLRLLFFLLPLTHLSFAAAGQTKQWDRTIGGDNIENLSSLQQTSDGGYILGGWSFSSISGDKTEANRGFYSDYWVVKLDADGNKEWDRTFGGSSQDVLASVQQTSDGGYILGGYSESDISGDKTEASRGGIDYWVVKLNAAGEKEWDRAFGGSNHDQLASLQQTSDGGYILGGTSQSGISGDKTEANEGDCDPEFGCNSDYWIVKLDAAGEKEWDRTFGGSDYDQLYSLQQTSDGGYILGGGSNSPISGDKTEASRGIGDYWVVKLNAAGEKEWDRTFGGISGDALASLQQTSDGGYILGGTSSSPISGDKTEANEGVCDPEYGCNPDYWIIKLDAAGEKEWDKTFGGNSSDGLTSLQQTSDGGYILGGYSASEISGDKTETNRGFCDEFCYTYDYWVVKLDAAGEKEWDRTFGGSSQDVLASVQQTNDGSYILGGTSSSPISGDKTEASRGFEDYWVVKLQEEACTPPEPAITLIPASDTYTGGDPAHLYLGYGPQSVTLQASGGTTYSWSPATGLSSATADAPVFTPTAPGSYTFTVTAANGACTATVSVTITVTDVRCGEKGDKVLLCHKGKALCIAPAAVKAHLAQHPQDKLGDCGSKDKEPKERACQATLRAYPNPFAARTTIALSFPEAQEYSLQLLDLQGNLVRQWPSARAEAGSEVEVGWEPEKAGRGVYILRLVTRHGVQHLRLMKE